VSKWVNSGSGGSLGDLRAREPHRAGRSIASDTIRARQTCCPPPSNMPVRATSLAGPDARPSRPRATETRRTSDAYPLVSPGLDTLGTRTVSRTMSRNQQFLPALTGMVSAQSPINTGNALQGGIF
jgi:hypothetical protein